jgi:hypothetical protein
MAPELTLRPVTRAKGDRVLEEFEHYHRHLGGRIRQGLAATGKASHVTKGT